MPSDALNLLISALIRFINIIAGGSNSPNTINGLPDRTQRKTVQLQAMLVSSAAVSTGSPIWRSLTTRKPYLCAN